MTDHAVDRIHVDSDAECWYLATRLEERLAKDMHGPAGEPVVDIESTLASLRAHHPYSDDELFARILSWRGLAPEEFARLCLEPAQQVRRRYNEPPGWLADLHGLPFGDRPDHVRSAAPLPGSGRAQPQHQQLAQLLDFVRPLVDRGVDALAQGVREIARTADFPLDAEDLCALLVPTWPRRAMTRLVIRVLLLELNIARLRGTLKGADSGERFVDFARRLGDSRFASDIWQAYPTLLRECKALVDAWVDARLEFCGHLCADLKAIRGVFPEVTDRELNGLGFEAGDGHRGGRSVGVLSFACGEQLVYKPRCLCVDRHFQDLLTWADTRGFTPGFATLRVLCRGDRGWSEFVRPSPCHSPDEIARFYRRHGGYLALMYALRAGDLHFENVIAAGEHPYLVDLEALFGADLRRDNRADDEVDARLMTSTVLATGLLPNPVVRLADPKQQLTDLSGITYRPGQLTAGEIPTWADPGSDTMRIVHRRMPMGQSANTPSLETEPVDPNRHVGDISAGFADMYRILERSKHELTADGGLLESFSGDIVRHVLEATENYGAVLWDSYHPNVLRNAVDRDRYLDRTLGRYQSYHRGFDVAVSERRQLAAGDIPIFTSFVEGRDLLGGDGAVVEDVLESSGMCNVRKRVSSLSPTDLRHQQWVIEAAFACAATDDLNSSWPVHTVPGRGAAPEQQTLIDHAVRIGDRLVATALRAGPDIGWLGITPVGDSAWRLAPTTGGLYSGAAGIALFLLYLGRLTEDSSYGEAAAAVARSLARRLARRRDLAAPAEGVPALGLSGEVDGSLYFLAHWSAVTGDLSFLSEAVCDLTPRLDQTIGQATHWDLVDGLAGTLIGLAAAHAVAPSTELAALATRCMDAIVDARVKRGTSAGWHSAAAGDTPLCGVAHGASGIALALERGSRALQTARYRPVIRQALCYESTMFDDERRHWPDLRPKSDNDAMAAWCHGAPGIGIVRAVLAESHDRQIADVAANDLTTALNVTMAAYADPDAITVRNLSLCHGELGNLEAVSTAAQALDSQTGRALAARIAYAVSTTLEKHGPVCGVPEGLSTPGLMTGIAGIGYGLLRLAAPDHVPSVLAFEPPRTT